MRTTHYDISVDVADLIEDLDNLDDHFIDSTVLEGDDEDSAGSVSSRQADSRRPGETSSSPRQGVDRCHDEADNRSSAPHDDKRSSAPHDDNRSSAPRQGRHDHHGDRDETTSAPRQGRHDHHGDRDETTSAPRQGGHAHHRDRDETTSAARQGRHDHHGDRDETTSAPRQAGQTRHDDRDDDDNEGDLSTPQYLFGTDDEHEDDIAPPPSSSSRPNRPPPPLPALSLIDEDDIDWITRLIDIVGACRGQPWRVALERIDGAQLLHSPVPHLQFAAAVTSLQRILSGRNHKAQLARACRELVLGHPALSQVTRTDRIAAAARALEIRCDDVERLLWADLPRERPVEFPFGRPSELEVAAFANVQLIQRAVRRAQTITIAVRGDAGPLIRGASTRGLLATVRVAQHEDRPGEGGSTIDNRTADNRGADNRSADNRGADKRSVDNRGIDNRTADNRSANNRSAENRSAENRSAENRSADNRSVDNRSADNRSADDRSVENRSAENRSADNRTADNRGADNRSADNRSADLTILDIVGPLTLCHRTAVYGRAIASLVPLLAECSAFELTLTASGSTGSYRSRVASPVLLPSLPAKATTSSSITARLARDLRRAMPSCEIVVGPSPILVGETFVCPDIVLDRGRLYIEIVGFWTAAYLARKRDAYASAGLDVVFCVDESRGCADDSLPDNVMPFSRHIDAAAILRRLPRA